MHHTLFLLLLAMKNIQLSKSGYYPQPIQYMLDIVIDIHVLFIYIFSFFRHLNEKSQVIVIAGLSMSASV